MKLIINKTNYNYVSVRLLIWKYSGLVRINNLEKTVAEELVKLISDPIYENPFILDFKDINTIEDHSFSTIIKCIDTKRIEVQLINLNEFSRTSLRKTCDSETFKGKRHEDGKSLILYYGEKFISLNHDSILEEISTHIKSKISRTLIDNIQFNQHNSFTPLFSTPILSNGHYDVSSISTHPIKFMWTCLLLSNTIKEIIEKNKIDSPIELLSVNLRSIPFAKSVAFLNNLSLKTIDHLGPYHKVWDYTSFNKLLAPKTNFIFLTDFIVGGTELKLSRLFAKFYNSDLEYALCIGSLFDESRFKEFNVTYLVMLDKLSEKLEFKI